MSLQFSIGSPRIWWPLSSCSDFRRLGLRCLRSIDLLLAGPFAVTAEKAAAVDEAAAADNAAEGSQAKEADAERHEQKLQEEELAAQKRAQAGDAHVKEIEQQAAAKVAEAEKVRVAMQSQHTSDLKLAAATRQEAE